jgi:L-asparaginase / beta-aspartyl-peptidase
MIRPFAMAIHGGAGTLSRKEMTPDKEAAYKEGLRQALQAGIEVLEKKGSALDAVEAAVRALEDHPLFNAGRGAAFNFEGKHELDAAIMNGATREAGAVACVKGIRNPVSLARAVMEKSDHVLLSGAGAEEFARLQQVELVPDSYFYTQERYDQLQKKKEKGGAPSENINGAKATRFGTVGAVALDAHGHLAVATSTGGLTNKRFGRIGDSPLIGGGTYANERVAVSCTGDGEYFIRTVAAYDVACLVEYKGLSLQEASGNVIHEKLTQLGGEGGLIAVDAQGNLALPFNSEGMYRAWQRQNETPHIEIY